MLSSEYHACGCVSVVYIHCICTVGHILESALYSIKYCCGYGLASI